MSVVTATDGTRIFYKDCGDKAAQPVVFWHGWPLSSDAWDGQMLFMLRHGFRVVAHDRRGHGCSDQPGRGNDMDTYADDLAAVLDARWTCAAPCWSATRPAAVGSHTMALHHADDAARHSRVIRPPARCTDAACRRHDHS